MDRCYSSAYTRILIYNVYPLICKHNSHNRHIKTEYFHRLCVHRLILNHFDYCILCAYAKGGH